MAITQIGYLGNTGPVYKDDAPGGGKSYIYVGQTISGSTGLRVYQPEFATNLGLQASDFTIGTYSPGQTIGPVPSDYKEPSTGKFFNGYSGSVTGYVAGTGIPGAATTTTTAPTGGSTTTTSSGGSTSAGSTTTTSSGGGTVTTTDNTFSAPTIMEQVSTFLSNYWWLVLLVVGFLLWKPVIAPALGFSKKRRSYR